MALSDQGISFEHSPDSIQAVLEGQGGLFANCNIGALLQLGSAPDALSDTELKEAQLEVLSFCPPPSVGGGGGGEL